tara:strand:- start:329 stop:874 length:546 start_codon:yes stop_codon:yes gene_type:complete
MFIYDENGNLTIRKESGLEYSFDNTDKPVLGFDYDVLIYDEIEVKITNWEEGKHFDEQVKQNLTPEECDSIELYIKNSEPPMGFSLNQQLSERLNMACKDYIVQAIQEYGFTDLTEITYAGREGSNHPLRSDARYCLDYCDTVWGVYMNIVEEIRNTREDTLKSFEEYLAPIPGASRNLMR